LLQARFVNNSLLLFVSNEGVNLTPPKRENTIEEESKAKGECKLKVCNYANPSVPNLASSFPEALLVSPQIPVCSVIYGRLYCAWPACCMPCHLMPCQCKYERRKNNLNRTIYLRGKSDKIGGTITIEEEYCGNATFHSEFLLLCSSE